MLLWVLRNESQEMREQWFRRAVGLTGIPGSGKSTAAEIFSELGSFVIDADQISRSCLLPDGDAYSEVVREFGESILSGESGAPINRRKLAKLVFSDSENRQRLESIVHPIVRSSAQKLAESCPLDQLLVYDCPLLFESHLGFTKWESGSDFIFGGAKVFKAIVVVETTEELAEVRYMNRTGVTTEHFQQVLAQQIPISEKVKYADFVINNSGNLDSLQSQILKLFQYFSSTLP